MSECENAEMRDRLPELLADSPLADMSAVRAHVDSCAECRAELALLTTVRAMAVQPRVDVARIANAIAPYRESRRARLTGSWWLRAAAGVVLAAGLGTVMTRPGGRAAPDTAIAIRAATPAAEVPVSAPLSDLTDAELQSLLDELDAIEAMPATESDVVVLPAFDRSGA